MKICMLAIVLLAFASLISAQSHDETLEDIVVETHNVNGLYIGFVPSALINPWTGYQAKLNYGFRDVLQLQLNGGWLEGQRSKYNFSGYRIRPAIKFFLPITYLESDRFYLGLEYNIRKITEKGDASFQRFGGLFVEELPFERITKSRSFILTFGSRTKIDNFLYLETGIGMGVGPLNVTTTQYPNADFIESENIFRPYQTAGDYSMLNILVHISFGIRLF